MNNLFYVAFGLLTALTVSGQDLAALPNDPMYSTHNYKHPNKAAEAARWTSKQGMPVAAPGHGTPGLANYKQPRPETSPTGGIEVPHTPSTSLAERNYKSQFGHPASRPVSQPGGVPRPASGPEGN